MLDASTLGLARAAYRDGGEHSTMLLLPEALAVLRARAAR